MKKLIPFVLIILLISAAYFYFSKNKKPKVLCHTGGAVGAYGYDWLSDDVLLKCDCQGKTVTTSDNLSDTNIPVCLGKINYTCYKLNTTVKDFPEGIMLGGPNFDSFLSGNSKQINCPSNSWMD